MISDRKKPSLSVVVPLYNERESLEALHEEIRSVCKTARLSFEVIYVDDGSTDGSFEVLESLHREDPRAKAIRFRKNFGKAEALSAGFAAARADRIVTMDADLQDNPEEIPHLIEALESGFDLVSGWKKKRHDPISKRLPSRLFNRTTSLLTGQKLHDYNCGLKIYRREVIEAVQVYGELHRYIPALALWEGFKVGEIPVNHRPRQFGKTKYGPSRFLKGLLDLVTVMFLGKFNKRPLHFFGLAGLISTLVGSGILIYLIVLRLLHLTFLSNRPILFLGVMLVISGIQFISIGLLGEMIARSAAKCSATVRQTLGL